MGILRADKITGLGGANAIKGSAYLHGNDDSSGSQTMNMKHSSLAIGTNEFCCDFWIYWIDIPTYNVRVVGNLNQGSFSNAQSWAYLRFSDGTSRLWNGSSYVSTGADNFVAGRWYHIAIIRNSGNNQGLYINGSLQSTTVSNTNDWTNDEFDINGRTSDGAESFRAYFSNVRLTIGPGASDLGGIVPVGESEVLANTKILCCNSPGNILNESAQGIPITTGRNTTANASVGNASRFTPNSPVGFSTTTDVGSQYGSTFDGFGSFATSTYMVPPGGNTRERNRGRAVLGGGFDTSPGAQTTDMQFFEVQSQGNTQTFGDLTQARWIPAAYASSTRACFAGGGSPSRVNTIDFVTIATTSNATNFGDLTSTRTYFMGYSSSTRGIAAGGGDPSLSDVIDYVTIATAGDATDFGNLTVARQEVMSACSPTRGLTMGGFLTPNPSTDVVDYVTIASTGNAIDFGDLTAASGHGAATSDNTRVIFAGGYSPGTTYSNKIEFFTTASTGNGTDFGDLITAVISSYGMPSDNTRGVLCGGFVSPANINSMQQITIQTTGNAVDFGDVTVKKRGNGGTSDSHGGLS